jgi:hypothetical protein
MVTIVKISWFNQLIRPKDAYAYSSLKNIPFKNLKETKYYFY